MLMPDLMEIRSSVVSILYGPADDGYTMVSLKNELGERVVAAGRAIPTGTQEGDELTVTGRWTNGKKGPLFAVQTARKALPRTTDGIQKWLEKAKVPGVGKIKASKLVQAFGMDTIDAIAEERPEAATIIGRKQIGKAAESVRSRRQEAEIGSTLSGHGVGGRLQKKILDQYGDRTHDVLTKEPYRLIMDVDGVAFATADKIAQAAGLAEDSPARIQASIVDILRDASRQGHCALYHQQLMERCRKAIYVRENLIEEQLAGLTPKHIVETSVNGMRAWATTRLNRAENEFARHVVRKLKDATIRNFGRAAIERAVDQAQQTLSITLSTEQRDGAIMALSENISILTGGPGTGKTHTLRVVCEAWQKLAPIIPVRVDEQREFALAAPTGKAAKRITETTGFEGRTIHRLLEYKPDINGFERNQGNPLMVGMICIDESSMPDIFISNDLARAWGEGRILLIGDIDQLPSVGPGKVLADLLASGHVPHTRLTQIFRQAAGSDISIGAEAIRQGRMPPVSKPGHGDLVHIELPDAQDAQDRIVQMYAEKMPAYAAAHGLDPASIQVLCPGHQSEVGTIALNRAIQVRLRGENPNGLQAKLADGSPAGAGDKVIQLENDYERGIYNGDTGTILEVEKDMAGGLITHVDFAGTVQTFEGNTLSTLSLAYALTIHKSQGSEYQIVIMPVTTSHYTMLRRTLLYTGTTRAKRLCVYVGTARAVKTAVTREDSTTRITTLEHALRREFQEAA
jgi:exodeoxyribonuclease V alpha subunit